MIPVTWHGLIHISYSACHHVILNSSMIMGILPNGELRSHKTYHLDPGLCNPTWRNWFTLATSKHQISSCIPTQIWPLLFSNWVTPQMSGFRMYSSNFDPISIISSYWLLLISDKFLPKPMSTSPFDPFQHSHGKIVIPSSIPHPSMGAATSGLHSTGLGATGGATWLGTKWLGACQWLVKPRLQETPPGPRPCPTIPSP